jgi:hypothetical protein
MQLSYLGPSKGFSSESIEKVSDQRVTLTLITLNRFEVLVVYSHCSTSRHLSLSAMPLDIDHPLGNLTQVIHLDHLKPPVKLLLRSTCSWRERKPWAVKLFGMFPRPRRRDHRLVIWECQMSAAEGVGSLGACKQGPEMRRRQKQEAIIDAINSGMLHIDLGGEEVLLDYLEENQAEVQQVSFSRVTGDDAPPVN